MRLDEGGEYTRERPSVDLVEPGLYRRRIGRVPAPWAPVRVWNEEERDEVGHLVTDVRLRAIWAPHPRSRRFIEINAYALQWRGLKEITEEEFQWLMICKDL